MKDFVILYFCPVQHLFQANIICCLCGTVAAAQMILGFNFGRDNLKNNEICAREKAKEFMTRFKEKNKVTCCRVLSSGYEGLAKKRTLSKFIADACEIIQDLVKVKV